MLEPKAFLEQSKIMYADEKRATRLLNVMGFARPMALKQSGYMGNIIRSKKTVKLKGVPFSDVFEEKKTGPFALRAPGYTTRHFHPMLEQHYDIIITERRYGDEK